MKNPIWIGVAFCAFAAGIGIGIYAVEETEPVAAAPLVIDFCSLATNQDYLVGTRVQTKAKMLLTVEGGVLESDSCPSTMLVFKAPSNDTCWQEIISTYNHNSAGPFAEVSVQVEGRVRGRRGLVRWIHEGITPITDAAHRAPTVSIDLDKIMSCVKN